jgi:hypothetical protein
VGDVEAVDVGDDVVNGVVLATIFFDRVLATADCE